MRCELCKKLIRNNIVNAFVVYFNHDGAYLPIFNGDTEIRIMINERIKPENILLLSTYIADVVLDTGNYLGIELLMDRGRIWDSIIGFMSDVSGVNFAGFRIDFRSL